MAKTPLDTAVASENRDGRKSAGTGAFSATDRTAVVAPAKAIVKNGLKDADVDITSGAPVRKQSMGGASYRITARYPAQTHEAAATTANGRIMTPTRSASGNFYVQQLDAGITDASHTKTDPSVAFPKGTWRP